MSVLLCYDGSPSAREAISLVGGVLARDAITVLHVWDPPEGVLADSFSQANTNVDLSVADLERHARERGQQTIAEAQRLASEAGLDAECRLERNRLSIWRTILRIAREVDTALIVMGTRGQVPVQQNLIGSVSRAVVQHAPIPVLIVPAPVDDSRTTKSKGFAASPRNSH